MLKCYGRPLLLTAVGWMVLIRILVSPSFAAYDDSTGFRLAADLLHQGSYLEALGAYHEIVTHSEIDDHRAKGLFFMGTIYSLYLDQYDEVLRLYELLMGSYSKSTFANVPKSRMKIGAAQLKSALFSVRESTTGISVRGKGFGHGVGMSQWGAYRTAQAGHNYREILKHYHGDIQITALASPQ